MLPYLSSQNILSTSCSLQTVIFTRMPEGHTGTIPYSQSQTSLLFSTSGTQHLSGGNVMLFSPTGTNIAVHACCRLPPCLAALGLTQPPHHQPEPFSTSTQSASLQHSVRAPRLSTSPMPVWHTNRQTRSASTELPS